MRTLDLDSVARKLQCDAIEEEDLFRAAVLPHRLRLRTVSQIIGTLPFRRSRKVEGSEQLVNHANNLGARGLKVCKGKQRIASFALHTSKANVTFLPAGA